MRHNARSEFDRRVPRSSDKSEAEVKVHKHPLTAVFVVLAALTALAVLPLGDSPGLVQAQTDEDCLKFVEDRICDDEDEEDEEDEDDEREEPRPNVGGIFGNIDTAQRNRERAGVIVPTPRPAVEAIRPPSTGDGGLLP